MEFWWGGVFVCCTYARVGLGYIGWRNGKPSCHADPASPASKESGPLAAAFVDTAYWLWMDVKSQQQLLPSRRNSKGLLLALYIISLSLFSSFRRCPAVDVWRINRMESTPPVNSLDTPFSHRVSTHTCIPLPFPTLLLVYVTQEIERSLFCRFLCCTALHCCCCRRRSGVTGIIQRRGPIHRQLSTGS